MFQRFAVADHCEMVIMQFSERAWPCSNEWLKSVPDFDLRIIESGRGVLFPFSLGVIERLHSESVSRFVSRSRYSPARVLATVVCFCATNQTRSNVVGWFLYDFTMGNL